MKHTLSRLPHSFAVCRYESAQPGPEADSLVVAVTFGDEHTLVCRSDRIPRGAAQIEDGWVCYRIDGVLPFDAVGVLASLVDPLKSAGVPVFVVSTFSTDLVFVPGERTPAAVAAWSEAGVVVSDAVAAPAEAGDSR